jgi:hypothetical protein
METERASKTSSWDRSQDVHTKSRPKKFSLPSTSKVCGSTSEDKSIGLAALASFHHLRERQSWVQGHFGHRRVVRDHQSILRSRISGAYMIAMCGALCSSELFVSSQLGLISPGIQVRLQQPDRRETLKIQLSQMTTRLRFPYYLRLLCCLGEDLSEVQWQHHEDQRHPG